MFTTPYMTREENTIVRLQHAAGKGMTEQVAHLISLLTSTNIPNTALVLAAQQGHMECVKLLIPISDTSDTKLLNEYSSPMFQAVRGGHIECGRLLLPVTNEHWIHFALSFAAQHNRIDFVKLLVGACNPKDHNSLPLQLAAEHNNEECIDLLYDCSEPMKALEALRFKIPNLICWSGLEKRIEAQRLRGVLSKNVDEGAPDRKHKM